MKKLFFAILKSETLKIDDMYALKNACLLWHAVNLKFILTASEILINRTA